MHDLWVGPIPPQQFLDDFLPEHSKPRPPAATIDLFKDIPNASDNEMHESFVHQVQHGARLIPGFKILLPPEPTESGCNSPCGEGIRLGPSMFRADVDLSEGHTLFGQLELHFEFKKDDSKDPFVDPPHNITPEDRLEFDIVARGQEGVLCRSQICSYASRWMSRQHRLFAFTIYLGDPWVRFIRWDYSGTVVSQKFDYRKDASYLTEFLWRFVHLEDERRGLDPTVRRGSVEDIKVAEEHLSEWKPPTDYPSPVFVMDVPVDGDRTDEFIIWGAILNKVDKSFPGRSTRGYPAYDKANGRMCFLKDLWRVENFLPESTLLKLLNANGVRNVTSFQCGGDLPQPLHATATNLYTPQDHGSSDGVCDNTTRESPVCDWRCGRSFERIRRRIHHRFVVNFGGRPLRRFESSKQLLSVVFDAVIAHWDAYVKCKVIHRDISIDNILITEDGAGVLIDWDVAKFEDNTANHEAVGTFHFMSSLRLAHLSKPYNSTIQDDMESFIHVVFYLAFLKLDHTKRDRMKGIKVAVFDSYYQDEQGNYSGGDGKYAMLCRRGHIGTDFEFKGNEPLNLWVDVFFEAAANWLMHRECQASKSLVKPPTALAATVHNMTTPRQEIDPGIFATHEGFCKVWAAILTADDSLWPRPEAEMTGEDLGVDRKVVCIKAN